MAIQSRSRHSILLAIGMAIWSGGILGCSGFKEPSPLLFVADQSWADSAASVLMNRLEVLWGHRFQRRPAIELLAADRSTVLDSFPMAVRCDPVVRRVWQAVGLYREPQAEAIHAGRLRRIATRAVYVPKTHRILLVPGSDEKALEMALAHELVHALQSDVSPMLVRLARITDEDEMVGYLGALEGQATFLAPKLVANAKGPDDCLLPESPLLLLSQAIQRTPEFASMPPALTLPSYAPYVYGWQIVCEAVARHGSAGMDSLLERPPAGSWQLWHPRERFEGHHAVDWDTASTNLELPRIWSPVGQARIGEVRLAALLLEWDRRTASLLLSLNWLDWEGDRVWVARQRNDSSAFAWILRFRSRAGARAFGQAWWHVQSVRNAATYPKSVTRSKGRYGTWESPTGEVDLFSQEGRNLYLLHGFPQGLSQQLLHRLRKLRQTQGPKLD